MTRRPGSAVVAPASSGIDWDALKRKLAAAVHQTAAHEPGSQTYTRILRERARTAARSRDRDDADEPQAQVVEFTVAHERHAVEIAWVKEVLALRELTPLPGTPAFVAGILNVRGRIVPVVDLKTLFGLPDKGLTELNRVVVVGDGALELGLLADAVTGVRRLRDADVQPPVPTLAGLRHEYLRGLTADRLAVLDAARLVADPRLSVRRERPARS